MKSRFLEIAKKVNNFYFNGLIQRRYLPLLCHGDQVGIILPKVASALDKFPDVFIVTKEKVIISPLLTTIEERSDGVQYAMKYLHSEGDFVALKGWRNEFYDVKNKFSEKPVFKLERAAAPVLGVKQFNVHIHGIYDIKDQKPLLCLQRRSDSKQTWPGMLDTFVSGGMSSGADLLETVKNELEEEANVTQDIDLSTALKSAGANSFLHLNEDGIYPITDFVFDLKLPDSFVPSNNDGEVAEFKSFSYDEVLDSLLQLNTKMGPGTKITLLDFFIRKGVLALKNEPNLPELLELLHIPLHTLFQSSKT